ncbi:MAG: hypothetical protein JSR33_03020 [Proteobacteria bacterium]|nr:hypothetical protein [Pseudomonadota bacterium]
MKEVKIEDKNVFKMLERLKAKRDEHIAEFLRIETLILQFKTSKQVDKIISLNPMYKKPEQSLFESLLSSATQPVLEHLEEDSKRFKSAFQSLEVLIVGFEKVLSEFNPESNALSTLEKMKELVNTHKTTLNESKPRNSFSRAYNQISMLIGKTVHTATMDCVDNFMLAIEKLLFPYQSMGISIQSEKDEWELLSFVKDEDLQTDDSSIATPEGP